MKDNLKKLLPYIIVVIVVILIKVYVVTPIRVNGKSMEPTLYERDIMILNKTAYYFNEPERFDIVVVNMPDEYLIKRVIGLPGDVIEYKDNKLYVNGEEVDDGLSDDIITNDFSTSDLGSEVIPDDCYLVLGDNRENSLDSRELGFISKDQIIGRTSLTILPFDRIGFKE